MVDDDITPPSTAFVAFVFLAAIVVMSLITIIIGLEY